MNWEIEIVEHGLYEHLQNKSHVRFKRPFNAEVSIVIRKKYLKGYVYKEDEIDN